MLAMSVSVAVVVVVVVVDMLLVVRVLAENIDVACYPNGTAEISNPDDAIYTSVNARNNVTLCTTAWASHDGVAKALAVISGCAINLQMDVIFSTRELGLTDNIIGGDNVYAYSFLCDEIPESGVDRTFTQGLTNKLSTVTQASVSPTFTIKSSMRLGSETGAAITSATVGEMLYWSIDVPDEYTAIPTSCTAYAGTSTSGSISKLLITDGCSQDVGLVQHFNSSNVASLPHEKRYFTILWAFKFASFDDVLFHCDVMFCPGTANCDIGTCQTRRRRAVTTGNVAGMTYGSTSRVLRVTEVIPITSGVGSVLAHNIKYPTLLYTLLTAIMCSAMS